MNIPALDGLIELELKLNMLILKRGEKTIRLTTQWKYDTRIKIVVQLVEGKCMQGWAWTELVASEYYRLRVLWKTKVGNWAGPVESEEMGFTLISRKSIRLEPLRIDHAWRST
jgi:hypothetical protein